MTLLFRCAVGRAAISAAPCGMVDRSVTHRFIVTQIGARHRYAVPAILAEAGLLERFYTDIAGNVGYGAWLAALASVPGAPGRLRRLRGRQVPEAARARTRSFAGPFLRRVWRSAGVSDAADLFRAHLLFNEDWARAMASEGFGGATHLLSMLGEGGPYLREAKGAGLRVVSDVYARPEGARILVEERRRFPGWEDEPPDHAAIKAAMQQEDYLFTCSDWFLCPSEAVRDDLVLERGVDPGRIRVVPYGVHPDWLEIEPRPVRGRILFAGTANLGKGLHYLAIAADKLERRRLRCEIRVAGDASPRVREQAACRHLTFLGRLDRAAMPAEFQAADVLVLPSLAEGSAGVTYEALAAGVPVVTTRAAGSVVRDGVEGRIVPERDPEALAEAIEEIVEDRALRARMSEAARERAREYTWARHGQRLLAALGEMR